MEHESQANMVAQDWPNRETTLFSLDTYPTYLGT